MQSIKMNIKALLALSLLSLVACDAVEDMKGVFDKQAQAQEYIKRKYGWNSQLAFNINNGVLSQVTLYLNASDTRAYTVAELEAIARELVAEVFSSEPQAIYIQIISDTAPAELQAVRALPDLSAIRRDCQLNDDEYIIKLRPQMPELAQKNAQEGWVVVQFNVEGGAANSINVVDASPQGVFDNAVIASLEESVFKPEAKKDGCIRITKFKLADDNPAKAKARQTGLSGRSAQTPDDYRPHPSVLEAMQSIAEHSVEKVEDP
ncbi:TonB protein C-terminal [Alteromonadaceae bacterium Bs31]|nr:TonB protein C-terminal [Alteromonadaceae bacterium Bs31]